MSTVEVRGLTKAFAGRPPVHALRGIDLDVASESLVAVLGPSGCGKTTLLRLLAGFDRPDAGTIVIGEHTVAGPDAHVAPERRQVGIVPQEGALFPHLDVAANIAFGLRRAARRSRAGRARRVDELLELVGLAGYGARRPHQLSGGQQQRVALARALAPEPAIVLLDEPFAALDTGLRGALRDDVAAALRASATTAVLVTHDQTEALTLADMVAVMRDGSIVQCSTPDGLYQRPLDLDTARFLGEVVVLPGHADAASATATCILGRLSVAPTDRRPPPTVDQGRRPVSNLDNRCTSATGAAGGSVQVMLRPEQIVVDRDGPVTATVGTVRFEGHDALVHLELADQRVLARWSTVDLPATGDVVRLGVRGEAVVFP